MSERLLDAGEVAAMLSVPRSWVLESARRRSSACVRLGRYVRFDEADVEVVDRVVQVSGSGRSPCGGPVS